MHHTWFARLSPGGCPIPGVPSASLYPGAEGGLSWLLLAAQQALSATRLPRFPGSLTCKHWIWGWGAETPSPPNLGQGCMVHA